MAKKYFKPYYEAAKKILKGTPVKNLDEIREECNHQWRTQFRRVAKQQEYTSKAIIVSFIADAENKILLGADPNEIYGKVGENPVEIRKKGRKILEDAVTNYLN